MAATQESPSFADAVVKEKLDDEILSKEESMLNSMEAQLRTAEAQMAAADRRYRQIHRQVAEELAKPLVEPPSPRGVSLFQVAENEEKAIQDADARGHTEHYSKEPKNAAARSAKQVSCDRWLAARCQEARVREAGKKAREVIRRRHRDRKQVETQMPDEAAVENGAKDTEEFQPNPRVSLALDQAVVRAGAQIVAERVNCICGRSNEAEKRVALNKVCFGGRTHYYRFEAVDVIANLRERGFIKDNVHDEAHTLLTNAPRHAEPVPHKDWLDHAQKMSTVERVDDRPFKEAEFQYFRWLDERSLIEAEAELQAAESRFSDVVQRVQEKYPVEANTIRAKISAGKPIIDEEYAEDLEVRHNPARANKGSKNTSQIPDKVLSSEKWMAARDAEEREREHTKKVRDVRRGEARDMKHDAANVDA